MEISRNRNAALPQTAVEGFGDLGVYLTRLIVIAHVKNPSEFVEQREGGPIARGKAERRAHDRVDGEVLVDDAEQSAHTVAARGGDGHTGGGSMFSGTGQ